MNTSSALVRYDAMCRAIGEAYKVDEVKQIRDKSLALEAYFRQAKNTDAERKACEIRLRAERKAGELLKGMEKAKGGGDRKSDHRLPSGTSDAAGRKALADLGISKKQSAKWQQLADVPEEDFEAALAAPKKPSTSSIVKAEKKGQPMDPCALWLWGRLRDFEREGVLHRAPAALVNGMTEAMQADVRRLAPLVAEWLADIS